MQDENKKNHFFSIGQQIIYRNQQWRKTKATILQIFDQIDMLIMDNEDILYFYTDESKIKTSFFSKKQSGCIQTLHPIRYKHELPGCPYGSPNNELRFHEIGDKISYFNDKYEVISTEVIKIYEPLRLIYTDNNDIIYYCQYGDDYDFFSLTYNPKMSNKDAK